MSLKNEHSHTNKDFEAVRAHALLNVKTGNAEIVGLTLVGDVAGLWSVCGSGKFTVYGAVCGRGAQASGVTVWSDPGPSDSPLPVSCRPLVTGALESYL